MTDQDAFAGSAHAMLLVMFLQPLQACEHRGILLWLVLFGPKGVVAERIQADGGRLVCVERLRNGGPICEVLKLENFAEAQDYLSPTHGYEDCCAFLVIVDIALWGSERSSSVDRSSLYAATLSSW